MLNSGGHVPHSQESIQGEQESGKRVVERIILFFEHSMERIDERTLHDLSRLLKPEQAMVTLIHALPDPLAGMTPRYGDTDVLGNYLQEREQQQATSRQDLSQLLQWHGFQVQEEQTYYLKDQNLESLLEQINRSSQDLLVLCGNHAPSKVLARNHTLMNLAAHATIPVLLLKKHLFGSRQTLKVLMGIDDTEASMNAARKLGALVCLEGAGLTLATVQSPIYQENAVLAPFVNQDVLDEALKSNALMLFDMVTDLLQVQNIQVESNKTLLGSPATELGYLAELENPDLLVVGSHNRQGFMAWVMGSVSSQLLHWDTHNLLIIR